MKSRILTPFISGILLVGCAGKSEKPTLSNKTTQGPHSSDTQDESEPAYLTDAVEAAVDAAPPEVAISAEGSSPVAVDPAPPQPAAPIDMAAVSDLQGDGHQSLAAMVMKRHDTDNSGSLTLDEFLQGPHRFLARNRTASPQDLEKVKDFLTAEFKKYSGEDGLMSHDDLSDFLAAQAPRVSAYRIKFGIHRQPVNIPGVQRRPAEGSKADCPTPIAVFKGFDVDCDGKLDQTELMAFVKAMMDRHPVKKSPMGTPIPSDREPGPIVKSEGPARSPTATPTMIDTRPVKKAPVAAPICTIIASAATVKVGESVSLNVNIRGSVSSVTLNGKAYVPTPELDDMSRVTAVVTPSLPDVYSYVAFTSGPGGSATCSVQVTVTK